MTTQGRTKRAATAAPTKSTKPIKYEVFLRIQCPDTECKGWTGMTLRDRPDVIRCVLCDAVIKVGRLDEDGFEYRRRGPWIRPLLGPQAKEAANKAEAEKLKAREDK